MALIMVVIGAWSAIGCARWTGFNSEPRLEITPLAQSGAGWMIVTSEKAAVTVTAPGAQLVKIIYQPIAPDGYPVELRTIDAPDVGERFLTEIDAGARFSGHVWAQIFYPDGKRKVTAPLKLAFEKAIGVRSAGLLWDSIGGSIGSDESERSDKITGGAIEQAALAEDRRRIWLTVNIPAFQLTLWQDGKEIKSYPIGVGRADFPLPVGARLATSIIWNPEWVPPDSSWVAESDEVFPGETVYAEDPRNPLGKIKVTLGRGILIHEAAKPSDIGGLVSHGCVRMRTEDIYDLTEKIIAACQLHVEPELIEQAKMTTERLAVKLDPPVYVDINYDTVVIEGSALRIYRDVYKRGGDRLETLLAELRSNGIDDLQLDESLLRQMLDSINLSRPYIVQLKDLKLGRVVMTGKNFPPGF
jgi:hypothetical protein